MDTSFPRSFGFNYVNHTIWMVNRSDVDKRKTPLCVKAGNAIYHYYFIFSTTNFKKASKRHLPIREKKPSHGLKQSISILLYEAL